jgi:hypothetical protein
MWNMKQIGTFMMIAAIIVIAAGCHPEPNGAELYDELVVATNFDPDADFSTYHTFSIPNDTLGLISNTSPNDSLLVSGITGLR